MPSAKVAAMLSRGRWVKTTVRGGFFTENIHWILTFNSSPARDIALRPHEVLSCWGYFNHVNVRVTQVGWGSQLQQHQVIGHSDPRIKDEIWVLKWIWIHYSDVTWEAVRLKWPGGRFKNTYELLNLRALKISKLHKNHIFQCMGKIFCVEFHRVPLKFHTKYLTHTLKDVDLFTYETLRALWFKSS